MHKYTNTQLNKCIDIDMLNKEHTNTCPLYVSVYTQKQHESMLVCTCLYKYVPKQISIFKHKCIHVYIYIPYVCTCQNNNTKQKHHDLADLDMYALV